MVSGSSLWEEKQGFERRIELKKEVRIVRKLTLLVLAPTFKPAIVSWGTPTNSQVEEMQTCD